MWLFDLTAYTSVWFLEMWMSRFSTSSQSKFDHQTQSAEYKYLTFAFFSVDSLL